MRLLLTSGGVSNNSIVEALKSLLYKEVKESRVVFVPTAANLYAGDKGWLVKNIQQLIEMDFLEVDIVDISAVPRDNWYPRFVEADVLVFGGGSNFHLMDWMRKSGLEMDLTEFLKKKVYVGISAGSMVASKDTFLKPTQVLYEEELDKAEDVSCLNYVDFYILPHLNSRGFKNLRRETIEKVTGVFTSKIYCIDDETAIVVEEQGVRVVSEGKWFMINNEVMSSSV